jgi:hypothetical protein
MSSVEAVGAVPVVETHTEVQTTRRWRGGGWHGVDDGGARKGAVDEVPA